MDIILTGTDHIECYVGIAKQAAHFYQTAFDFRPLAYAGPETGMRDRASYVLAQGKIRLVLPSPLGSEGAIAEHIRTHGDGMKVLALGVENAFTAYAGTVARGAQPWLEPCLLEDEGGRVRLSGIKTFGDTVHVFVERRHYRGAFLPGYRNWSPEYGPGEAEIADRRIPGILRG